MEIEVKVTIRDIGVKGIKVNGVKVETEPSNVIKQKPQVIDKHDSIKPAQKADVVYAPEPPIWNEKPPKIIDRKKHPGSESTTKPTTMKREKKNKNHSTKHLSPSELNIWNRLTKRRWELSKGRCLKTNLSKPERKVVIKVGASLQQFQHEPIGEIEDTAAENDKPIEEEESAAEPSDEELDQKEQLDSNEILCDECLEPIPTKNLDNELKAIKIGDLWYDTKCLNSMDGAKRRAIYRMEKGSE